MTAPPSTTLVSELATELRDAFLAYDLEFRVITQRARVRFERRDWHAGQRDAAERIGLYDRHAGALADKLTRTLGAAIVDRSLWRAARARYAELVADHPDVEFTKTWFSSLTRRLFGTAGVDRDIEFSGAETIPLRNVAGPLIGRSYVDDGSLHDVLRQLLADFAWGVPYAHPEQCAALAADEITAHWREHHEGDTVLCVDALAPVFYRDSRAYVIGRATGWTRSTPLVLAFRNDERGIALDAVIQGENAVSVLFGFARSYFHVDLECVGAAIVFLRKLLPRETVNELFTILGRAKQGKTERFRGLSRHLEFSTDRFVTAPGKRGMVMAVFTLPSHDVVFKVIRDTFAPPKDTTREKVETCYELVKRHNTAGRLVDTQEFRMLELRRERFESALLDELLEGASRSVAVEGDAVVIRHCYLERRLRPLDLYLREVGRAAAARAVVDYGQALRDLAATNVFPGDLLLKNFGVSRQGRVIFYDYDEVCLLTDCTFRELPHAATPEDEMSAEPWFAVREGDVFPEEFRSFLGLDAELMAVFEREHGELLTADWWRAIQARLQNGEILEVLPY